MMRWRQMTVFVVLIYNRNGLHSILGVYSSQKLAEQAIDEDKYCSEGNNSYSIYVEKVDPE